MVASAAATVPYMILSWEQIAMVLAPGMVKNACLLCLAGSALDIYGASGFCPACVRTQITLCVPQAVKGK